MRSKLDIALSSDSELPRSRAVGMQCREIWRESNFSVVMEYGVRAGLAVPVLHLQVYRLHAAINSGRSAYETMPKRLRTSSLKALLEELEPVVGMTPIGPARELSPTQRSPFPWGLAPCEAQVLRLAKVLSRVGMIF